MASTIPGRFKWFFLLGVFGAWNISSMLLAMPRVPRPALPEWIRSSNVLFGLLAYSVISVVVPFLTIMKPGVIDRRIQARAKGNLTRERLAERVVKIGAVFPLVPLLAGFIAVFLSAQLTRYWLFVPVYVLSGVAY